MHFSSTKEELLNAIQVVQRAVSPRNPLPILSGIKFETGEGSVTISATDLELGISCSFPAEISEPGKTVLPARVITELARRFPNVKIFFKSDPLNGSVIIQYGKSEASINGYPVEEFPEFTIPADNTKFTISGEILKEVISQVIFATARDENRPLYTGILFEINNGTANIVATDTHRLAWRKILLDGIGDLDINLIIPGKTLNELTRVAGLSDRLDITVAENQVIFETKNISLVSRLIGGNFPNYRQVIPGDYISKTRLKTRDLIEASERASLLTSEGAPIIKISIENSILVVSVNTEAGRMREEMSVYHEGEGLQFAFNARYLNDALKAIGTDEVVMEFTGPLSPVIIKPVEEMEYLSLLLPVRLREES
ncbi:MAG: DNA polymerase III subunit beta [Peptococcaceae bacterium]|nr:DNA polymerase III subunit beta [Peptococcaceae bacterium]